MHVPILLAPITEALTLPLLERAEPAWILDCTFGGGGHTKALLDRLPKHHGVVGIDQDEVALLRGKKRLSDDFASGRLKLLQTRFGDLDPETLAPHLDGKPVYGILADLGFSSDQLEDPERGISFMRDGPLDMRLNREDGLSAYEFLKSASEKEIADIIYEFGEEHHSRRVARFVCEARSKGELPSRTAAFAALVERAIPGGGKGSRIHAATRTFQALRIHVNGELRELDNLLGSVIMNLEVGGRLAVISFHSLEDRRVKQKFKSEDSLSELTKKPIEADESEMASNPRSRSAKLRIATRLR
ncbi:MAG: 16S rRNA (cytosine(1402)-N(4))-methyltransferase RsmH [Cryobacterium sp.]|nr:16S rRNA (cytosine(1402)-N(4))-methyltransferase RsmH [Oligoflexia bacterium]